MLERLSDGDLCRHVREVSEYFIKTLKSLQSKYPSVVLDVRGRGLMLGIKLAVSPRLVIDAAMERGLLVASAGYDVLRFVPPLTVTNAEVDQAVSILDDVFSAIAGK